MSKKIFVTQPYLPPFEEFVPYLKEIWDSRILTNNGPYHQQFERALEDHLGIENLALFANATLALVTSLQALRIQGEVITTPYSFVATSHSLLWNGITPVFVDIDPRTCNIDASKIESAITPNTKAILAVHCYGHPCDVEAIQQIADTYGLKVIYDAAHSFGVKYRNQSILSWGDFSILSFHATKIFNTFEGGALICPDPKTKQRVDYLKNFGFADELTVMAPGINGKMSEFGAALGLVQLKYIERSIARRREIASIYRSELLSVAGIETWGDMSETQPNHSYFPVTIEDEFPVTRDVVYDALRQGDVHARRYFYPLISDFPMYRGLPSAMQNNLPQAIGLSKKVICLPIYPDLSDNELARIIDILKNVSPKAH